MCKVLRKDVKAATESEAQGSLNECIRRNMNTKHIPWNMHIMLSFMSCLVFIHNLKSQWIYVIYLSIFVREQSLKWHSSSEVTLVFLLKIISNRTVLKQQGTTRMQFPLDILHLTFVMWEVLNYRRWPIITKHRHAHWRGTPQIAKFMGPTWGPPGSCQPQMGPMLAPWTLLSGSLISVGPGSQISWLPFRSVTDTG